MIVTFIAAIHVSDSVSSLRAHYSLQQVDIDIMGSEEETLKKNSLIG